MRPSMIIYTNQEWLEHTEIKFRNCLVKAEQFDKPYELENAKGYLRSNIMARMKNIMTKYC